MPYWRRRCRPKGEDYHDTGKSRDESEDEDQKVKVITRLAKIEMKAKGDSDS